MKLRNQGGTNTSDNSNSFVYIYLHTVVLIVNPVILNKQERFVFNAITFLIKRKRNV